LIYSVVGMALSSWQRLHSVLLSSSIVHCSHTVLLQIEHTFWAGELHVEQ
jgi:hypothetical protein